MPKYVTLDWYEYEDLKRKLNEANERGKEIGWFRYELILLVGSEEDKRQILDPFTSGLPPRDWEPLTNEEIIKRIKERFETPLI